MITTVYVTMSDGIKYEIHLVKCYDCGDIYMLDDVEEVVDANDPNLSYLVCWRCVLDEPRPSPHGDYLSRWEDTSSPPFDATGQTAPDTD